VCLPSRLRFPERLKITELRRGHSVTHPYRIGPPWCRQVWPHFPVMYPLPSEVPRCGT
jgi:hypothetical protein